MRGGGNDERRQILDKLAGFLERHGDSRFSDWTADGAAIRDRAGWWKPDDPGGRLYLFNADGLREALKGFDFKRALDVLESCGVIPKRARRANARKPRTSAGARCASIESGRCAAWGGQWGLMTCSPSWNGTLQTGGNLGKSHATLPFRGFRGFRGTSQSWQGFRCNPWRNRWGIRGYSERRIANPGG
jgi:hypothetical protein